MGFPAPGVLLAFICPQCQVENRSNAKYCRKCGQPRAHLEKTAEAVAATDPLPASVQSAQTEQSDTQTNSEHEAPCVQILPEVDDAPFVHEKGPNGEEPLPACPSCWATLRFTDKFCCWCGEPQPNRILPHMKVCLACKSLLPDKANYCYLCGEDVALPNRRKVVAPTELFYEESSEFFPRFDA